MFVHFNYSVLFSHVHMFFLHAWLPITWNYYAFSPKSNETSHLTTWCCTWTFFQALEILFQMGTQTEHPCHLWSPSPVSTMLWTQDELFHTWDFLEACPVPESTKCMPGLSNTSWHTRWGQKCGVSGFCGR